MTKARALTMGWERMEGLPKHRYVYLIGNKTQRKDSRRRLLLDVLPYPKACTEHCPEQCDEHAPSNART